MASFPSLDHADQVISGAVAPEDLPAGAARVAGVLGALRSPMTPDGAREQEAEAQFVSAVRAAPIRVDLAGRRPARNRSVVARALVVTGALVLVGTGTAAAAGQLPDAAQSALSRVLEHVDVHVPNPDAADADPAAGGEPDGSVGRDAAAGPDATGAARHGLCTAWAAHDRQGEVRGARADSVAFVRLTRAADDAGVSVADFCADELGDRTPGAVGEEPSGPKDVRGRSGEDHGRGRKTPPVETPNGGGIDTGAEASDGANGSGEGQTPTGADDGAATVGEPGPRTQTRGGSGKP